MTYQNPKVLVVDDEPMVRGVCQNVLTRHDFTPILAANGLEALNIYRELRSDIALILSDVSMPVMDGPTFVRNLFALNPKSNVIFMTGFSPSQSAPEDLRRLCATIVKPFTSTQLIAAVKKCLDYEEQHSLV